MLLGDVCQQKYKNKKNALIVSKTFISSIIENISQFEVQPPGSGVWKNPGSETLVTPGHTV